MRTMNSPVPLPGCTSRAKDANWRSEIERERSTNGIGPTEQQWLDTRVNQMVQVSDSASRGTGDLLIEALAVVRRDRKKRPDNWLHENMSRRHHRSYTLFAARNKAPFSGDTVELNRRMYQILCRETHVGPRLDSFGIIHNRADDTVRIDISPRDLDKAKSVVLGATELAISEGIAALQWQRTGAV